MPTFDQADAAGLPQPAFDEIASGLRRANIALDQRGQRVALELLRAVADGNAVSAQMLAERTGGTRQEAADFIAGIPGVYLDSAGAVVGFWGLTAAEFPPHRYSVKGRELFVWCAWDPFILTDWLGGTASISTVDALTQQPLGFRIEQAMVTSLSHPQMVLSFKYVEEWDADVIAGFCHFVHYFADTTSARAWTAEHPGTFVISPPEAVALGRLWGKLVFPDLDPRS